MLPSLRSRARIAALATITAVMAMIVPGVAHAEPPSNDDFDHSTSIAALPFAARQDTSESTEATDDPRWCQTYDIASSVWFQYTATEDGLLRATTVGSDHSTILSANTGQRRNLYGVDNACDIGTDAQITFHATAGTTYHFMVSGYDIPGGDLSFALDTIPAAANDDFAGAEPVTTLPFTGRPDLSTASVEADEPESSCNSDDGKPSVWYAYTPSGPAASVTARVEASDVTVTVYTGNSLPELREAACARSQSNSLVFRANPGTTSYLRVTGPYVNYQPVVLNLAEAPALQPQIFTSSPATVYDDVSFSASSWNSIDSPLSVEWDFGDGTSSPRTTGSVSHRYAADGVYPITLRAASPDGRTATVTTQLTIATHDVAITKFAVPTAGREGQTKPITVDVANTRYLESATVVVSKSDGSSWTEVGSLTLEVPARPNRKVQFPFSYTFTPEDAQIGKVAFRARVELRYPSRDARPMDNEVIAIATTVKPRGTSIVAV